MALPSARSQGVQKEKNSSLPSTCPSDKRQDDTEALSLLSTGLVDSLNELSQSQSLIVVVEEYWRARSRTIASLDSLS
jgi:hypothetical protein